MKAISFLPLLILLSPAGWAQNISASLSGSLRDSLGAAIPGAEVKLSSEMTDFVRTTRTNMEGFFSFPDLTPSTYALSVSAAGFKSYVQSGIALSSSEKRSMQQIRMEVGQISESVTVTADAAPVMLGSGDRAGVLTTRDMESMALRGRDFMDAVGLLPGVIDTSDSREAPSNTSDLSVYILGSRANQKNITIDGITNLDSGGNGTMHNTPSMDAIGEIKVLMSNYAAEYGRNSGGEINIITRGGGKDFHASAGWYYRHENLTANNFFDNRNGVTRPRYRYNIGGYTLSGPVYIPGRFNRERSKLFFFFSQEFQRQLMSYGTRTVRVPTQLERAGDFSQTMDLNSRVVQVYDPLAGKQPFPNNVIPASRFSSIGRNVLNLFPLPNFVDPLPARRVQWNYISSLSSPYPRRTEIIRGDYSPRDNVQVYVRYSHTADEQETTYGSSVNGSVNFPLTPIFFRYPGRGAAAHTTFMLSPTFFNEFTFGFSQQQQFFYPENIDRVTRTGTGITIPQWYPAANTDGLIPNMSFGGVSNYANPSMDPRIPYNNSNPILSFTENLSKIQGTHSLKFGIYWERIRKDQDVYAPQASKRGTLSFDQDVNNPYASGHAYSNALLGYYTSYAEITNNPRAKYRATNLEWYAQDAWRIRPGLLIDYGVRFYHDMPQYDDKNQLATFVPGLYNAAQAPVLMGPALDAAGKKVAVNPLTGVQSPTAFIGTYAPGVGDPAVGMAVGGKNGFPRGLYTISPVTMAPRFGFSWDPFGRGRTAIRGGGGVFYDRVLGGVNMHELANPPTVFTPTIYYGTLEDLGKIGGSSVLAPSSLVRAILGNEQSPSKVYNFSFGVQQQIGRDTILDLAYVGSLSRNFLWARNINAVPAGARFLDLHPENRDPTSSTASLPPNFLRPYRGYGDIQLYEFGSTSNYNSLQLSANRRFRGGGQFGLAYTFSKALGSASSDGALVSAFFAPRQRNYGPLSFNRTHVLTLRYNYALPKLGKRFQLRALAAVADGWQIAGISRFISGAPFTPGMSTVDGQDITGTPSESPRPNVVDASADPLQRFGRPARGSFGNTGVGILTLPGVNNWDISIYRDVKLIERLRAQLRLETYNTFNHTQFSSISTSPRFDIQGNQVDSLFLQPTAARPPRRVQLAVRLNW